jgi:hypothetical protein
MYVGGQICDCPRFPFLEINESPDRDKHQPTTALAFERAEWTVAHSFTEASGKPVYKVTYAQPGFSAVAQVHGVGKGVRYRG